MPESGKIGDINQPPENKPKVPWWCSARLSLAFVGFLGFVNLYALRVNMSVAMVCMINNTAISMDTPDSNLTNTTGGNDQCLITSATNSTRKDGEFAWNKETQGIILGAFFWGYLITQIPGGWLSERFGGKRVFGWFMLLTAVSTLLTPVGARVSPFLLVFLRALKGIGQGVVFPAMHTLWATWAPPLERSQLIGFTYAGAQIGNVITFPVSGLLCEYGFDGGWPSIFYAFGIFGVVWFMLWMFIAADSPAQHRRITDVEKDYIQRSIGESNSENRKRLGTPWKKIFTSRAVWAIIVAHACSNWGTYTLLTNIPAYMREVLKFDIKANGALSAIPYLCFWALINIGGMIADYMRRKGIPTKKVRKIFLVCGTIIPGIFLIATSHIDCTNPYIAVALLSTGVGFSGFQYPGVMVNHVDIAPPFAGTLFGISNTMATIPGILAPYVIGRITVNQDQYSWRIVFYLSAVIYAIGAIFFLFFAEGEVQEWVRPYMVEDDATSVDSKVAPPHELGVDESLQPDLQDQKPRKDLLLIENGISDPNQNAEPKEEQTKL